MAKHVLEIRHRARANEPSQSLHDRLLQGLAGLDAPWQIDAGKVERSASIEPGELTRTIELGEALGAGLDGYLTYALRKADYLADRAQFDDVIVIEFDSRRHDFGVLADKVFPAYVQAFDAYRAGVIDDAAASANWPGIVALTNSSGKDLDGRDGLYRFMAVNFLDRELCRRAFGLSPEQVVDRLREVVPAASLFHEGALIRCGDAYMNAAQLAAMDESVRKALRR